MTFSSAKEAITEHVMKKKAKAELAEDNVWEQNFNNQVFRNREMRRLRANRPRPDQPTLFEFLDQEIGRGIEPDALFGRR